MRIELNEILWLEEHSLSLSELSELSGLPAALLEELIQAGGIEPAGRAGGEPYAEPHYGARALVTARRARRLREDFELDVSALLLVLGLLDRMAELEARLTEVQAKLPRRTV